MPPPLPLHKDMAVPINVIVPAWMDSRMAQFYMPACLPNLTTMHASGPVGLTTIFGTCYSRNHCTRPLLSLLDRGGMEREKRSRTEACLIFWHKQIIKKMIHLGRKGHFYPIIFWNLNQLWPAACASIFHNFVCLIWCWKNENSIIPCKCNAVQSRSVVHTIFYTTLDAQGITPGDWWEWTGYSPFHKPTISWPLWRRRLVAVMDDELKPVLNSRRSSRSKQQLIVSLEP